MKKNPLVLIVDDERYVRQTMEALLAPQGYEIAQAASGLEALEYLEQQEPDTILLDITMPGMDGLTLCHHIRSRKHWAHIPIIMITALDTVDNLVSGLDAGANDFLSKPVSIHELRARVRTMLRLKQQHDELMEKHFDLEKAHRLNQSFSAAFAQQLEALEVLHQTGLRLMHHLDFSSILELTLQTALDIFPEANACIIHSAANNEENKMPEVFWLQESSSDIKTPTCFGIESLVNQVINSGEYLAVDHLTKDQEQVFDLADEVEALMIEPLTDDKAVLGTISIYSRTPNTFRKKDHHVLSILANQTAVALEKAQALRQEALAQEEEKAMIRALFQRYVNPTVVDRLVSGEREISLGGERQTISIMFADIRGFSTFGEHIEPEYLVKTLNQYFALAVEPILANEGTLDKFMGDAIMAFFNAPLSQPDHTMRAVQSAWGMQQAIKAYNVDRSEDQALGFGLGIHVGQAVVGNIGATQQMNYTAVGNDVNLAKRLQEQANSGQIILSQAAYTAVQHRVTVEPLGLLNLKGLVKPEPAYALLDLKPSTGIVEQIGPNPIKAD